MAKLLLLETATEVCSVGLAYDGQLVVLRHADAPNDHSRLLTTLIAEVTAAAGWSFSQLDAVAISQGPGSYTSLRVGVATAKGLCYSLDKPLIAIDTLAALAIASHLPEAGDEVLYMPMIDARRNEVYTAVYNAALNALGPPQALVLTTAVLEDIAGSRRLITSGNGGHKALDFLPEKVLFRAEIQCSAAHLVKPAEDAFGMKNFSNMAYFEPLYLKPPYVTQPKK
jgi:tRNA threonylcarbamoyladenosine biosynthesis protein TsaB